MTRKEPLQGVDQPPSAEAVPCCGMGPKARVGA